jgi:hypothetical protein
VRIDGFSGLGISYGAEHLLNAEQRKRTSDEQTKRSAMLRECEPGQNISVLARR